MLVLVKLLLTTCKKNYSNDERIIWEKTGSNEEFSEINSRVFQLAKGEYFVFFKDRDLLSCDSLFEIVKAVNESKKDVDLIYSDEDQIDNESRKYVNPSFKPDFSPYYLCSYNYIGNLLVVKRKLLDEAGQYFDCKYGEAQDYDLLLRCIEKSKVISHIPKVLYHNRVGTFEDVSSLNPKHPCHTGGANALRAHLHRIGVKGTVLENWDSYNATYHIKYDLKETPLVSIIIPNCNHKEDLEKCLESIKKSTYKNKEVIIVENNSTEDKIFEYYRNLSEDWIKVIYWNGTFNYSAINNWAVKKSSGKYLVFMNNDIEIISENWLEEFLGLVQFDEVGAVGAKLYYPDQTIQHAGVILGIGGVAGHSHKYASRFSEGYMKRLITTQNLSAVTAALMIVKRSVFTHVQGFDEFYQVSLNDVDLCMKIRKAGYSILFNPWVEAWHYESKTRGLENTSNKLKRFKHEREHFYDSWGCCINDEFYNINLTLDREDFSLDQSRNADSW